MTRPPTGGVTIRSSAAVMRADWAARAATSQRGAGPFRPAPARATIGVATHPMEELMTEEAVSRAEFDALRERLSATERKLDVALRDARYGIGIATALTVICSRLICSDGVLAGREIVEGTISDFHKLAEGVGGKGDGAGDQKEGARDAARLFESETRRVFDFERTGTIFGVIESHTKNIGKIIEVLSTLSDSDFDDC